MKREDLGSWLNGPPTDQKYPGEHMGRPQQGPGSIARFGRRIIAFCIDWYLWWAVLYLLNVPHLQIFVLLVVWAYQSITIGLYGHTLGHFLCGMQVQTVDGHPVGLKNAILRSTLVMLVLPVFMMDADTRGVHDRVRNMILVRIR
ncbi:RDD family protein [Rothia sp. P7181]|uniref:RDD family protein n=1 Tax=unclassified Rothia (in: high G+C Gram-positive bacteria) TaxID=2689056 RepID=UPI003ACF8B41